MISLNLLFTIALLLLLLIILVIYYIRSAKKKKKTKPIKPKTENIEVAPPTFKELKAIIRDQRTTADNLVIAINQLIQYYGSIPLKEGIHPAKRFNEYASILIAVCRHKNTNAKIVLLLDKQLREKNPSYEHNIDEMLQRGLNSRA